MNIENYKLIDFLNKDPELITKYVTVLNYIKPIKTKKEVFSMKLKHVEFIKQNLYSSDDVLIIDIVSKVQKIAKEEVFDLSIIEFFGLVNSIKKQMERILNAEASSLSPSVVNQKWELVQGSEKMSKFGIYNTLDILAGGDVLKYKSIMNLNYDEVFTVLFMKKTKDDLNEEMSKLKIK